MGWLRSQVKSSNGQSANGRAVRDQRASATDGALHKDWSRHMLDGVSLDQLRTFIAAADKGSFSAAGRHLRRAQSVVSQTLANLEGQLGVKLFDRSARLPLLTDQGRALLVDARAVAGDIDLFKARARGLARGLEPELSVVADVMFPIAAVTRAVAAFRDKFPATALKLYIEGQGAVVQHVLDRRSAFGIMALLSLAP